MGALLTEGLSAPASGEGLVSNEDPGFQQKMFPWLDTSKYQECGQECLYTKSVENLSLQALYRLRVIRQLELEAETTPPKKRDVHLLGLMNQNFPAFCMASEGGQACLIRYKRIQVLSLYRIRRAIVHSRDAAAKLEDGPDRKNRYVFDTPVRVDEDKKMSHVTYVPTFEELQAQYQASRKDFQRLASQRYNAWIDSYQKLRPSEEDFVIFKEVLRDPSNPESDKITLVAKDCGGVKGKCVCKESFCYDAVAFEAANEQYKAWDEKERAKTYERMKKHLALVQKTRLPDKLDKESLTGRALIDERKNYVIEMNRDISAKGVQVPKEYDVKKYEVKKGGSSNVKGKPTATQVQISNTDSRKAFSAKTFDFKQAKEKKDSKPEYAGVPDDVKVAPVPAGKGGFSKFYHPVDIEREGHSVDVRTAGVGKSPALEVLKKNGRIQDSGQDNGRDNGKIGDESEEDDDGGDEDGTEDAREPGSASE